MIVISMDSPKSWPLPEQWLPRLAIPAIAAPMFLVSGPDLVVEACRNGVIGTFPALNQRTRAKVMRPGFTKLSNVWMTPVRTSRSAARYGVNLIVHKTNARVERDLAITVAVGFRW